MPGSWPHPTPLPSLPLEGKRVKVGAAKAHIRQQHSQPFWGETEGRKGALMERRTPSSFPPPFFTSPQETSWSLVRQKHSSSHYKTSKQKDQKSQSRRLIKRAVEQVRLGWSWGWGVELWDTENIITSPRDCG